MCDIDNELTYTAYGTESTTSILHPPRDIILGNRVLSRPLHNRCYFFTERLKKMHTHILRYITSAHTLLLDVFKSELPSSMLSFPSRQLRSLTAPPISTDISVDVGRCTENRTASFALVVTRVRLYMLFLREFQRKKRKDLNCPSCCAM